MSVLVGYSDEVFVIYAPSVWITTRPGQGSTDDRWKCYAGGTSWSDTLRDAVLFQSHEAAKAHVDAMNLREWRIDNIGIVRRTRPADVITLPGEPGRIGGPVHGADYMPRVQWKIRALVLGRRLERVGGVPVLQR